MPGRDRWRPCAAPGRRSSVERQSRRTRATPGVTGNGATIDRDGGAGSRRVPGGSRPRRRGRARGGQLRGGAGRGRGPVGGGSTGGGHAHAVDGAERAYQRGAAPAAYLTRRHTARTA